MKLTTVGNARNKPTSRKRPRERKRQMDNSLTNILIAASMLLFNIVVLNIPVILVSHILLVDGFGSSIRSNSHWVSIHNERRQRVPLQYYTWSISRLYAKSGTKKKKKGSGSNMVAVNRIAYRNYEVIDTLEAGISLLGTEVKSIRDGKLNLRDGYVKPCKNGRSCTLHNVHVGKCDQVGAEYFQHEEKRPRTLLVHKSEARKFLQQTEQQGMTVIPLKAYWNDKNKLKIQIALCRGKNVRDKRATIQERDMKRETNRIIKNFRIA
jgi:SsrA-binding protein